MQTPEMQVPSIIEPQVRVAFHAKPMCRAADNSRSLKWYNQVPKCWSSSTQMPKCKAAENSAPLAGAEQNRTGATQARVTAITLFSGHSRDVRVAQLEIACLDIHAEPTSAPCFFAPAEP